MFVIGRPIPFGDPEQRAYLPVKCFKIESALAMSYSGFSVGERHALMFSSKHVRPKSKAGTQTDAAQATSFPGRDRRYAPLFVRSTLSPEGERVIRQPGHPLDTTTLQDLGARFSYDFSDVRVHTDDRAAETAASAAARAYTFGRHVVFGRNEYAPGTSTGRRLLGHELAHVIQQSRGGLALPGATPGLEPAADRAADQVARGVPAEVYGASKVGLACQTIFDQFSAGKYMWSLLKGALEHGRPAAELIDDVNHLTSAERNQAIDDIVHERARRARDQGFRSGQQSVATDPALFDPVLAQGQGVLDRIDAVLDGLTPAGYGRKPIPGPGWNFTPQDFARLQGAKKNLTVAADSGWFPSPLQTNLLNTLAFVLGSTASSSATEGVNAVDFFHGHLVIKKDPATKSQSDAALKSGNKYEADMKKETARVLNNFSAARDDTVTNKTMAAYKPVMEKMEPALGVVLATAATVPGAAVMYHTFEFISPREDKAKGKEKNNEDPRRHYVTPVASNSPQQYTPPAGDTYEKEYTHIAKFSFLVDTQGAVHVRPFNTDSGFATMELSVMSGTALPDTLFWDKPTTGAKKP